MSVKISGRIVNAMYNFVGKRTYDFIADGNGSVYATDNLTILQWRIPLGSALDFEGKFYEGKPFLFDFIKDKYIAAEPVYMDEFNCKVSYTCGENISKFFESANKALKGDFEFAAKQSNNDTVLGDGVVDAKLLERMTALAKAVATTEKTKVPAMRICSYNNGVIATVSSSTLGHFNMCIAGRRRI